MSVQTLNFREHCCEYHFKTRILSQTGNPSGKWKKKKISFLSSPDMSSQKMHELACKARERLNTWQPNFLELAFLFKKVKSILKLKITR